MPNFFSYPRDISNELHKMGFKVDLFYEQPPLYVYLIFRKIYNYLGSSFLYKLYEIKLILSISLRRRTYDYFLVIRGNILSGLLLNYVKKHKLNEHGICTYYTWDSFVNLNHKGKLGDFFDYRYSFDSIDVNNNHSYQLLPLFFTENFDIPDDDIDILYDVCCIASLNKYRYSIVKRIVETNPTIKFKIVLYIDKKLYKVKRKTDPFFRELNTDWISFNLLSEQDIIQLYKHSKAILDITYKRQNGLSMRTIESIGLKKKLITNNQNIKTYNFYNQNNVFLYNDSDNMYDIDSSWINKEYIYSDVIREDYSLHSWLIKVIGLNR